MKITFQTPEKMIVKHLEYWGIPAFIMMGFVSFLVLLTNSTYNEPVLRALAPVPLLIGLLVMLAGLHRSYAITLNRADDKLRISRILPIITPSQEYQLSKVASVSLVDAPRNFWQWDHFLLLLNMKDGSSAKVESITTDLTTGWRKDAARVGKEIADFAEVPFKNSSVEPKMRLF
jgi:hypothetical protein